MNSRLVHDVAFSTATVLMEIVGLALPPDVQKEAFDEMYATVHSGILAYEEQRARMENRLNPTESMN